MPTKTMSTAVTTIDGHIARVWLQLCTARREGRSTTAYTHIIDNLLDQRLEAACSKRSSSPPRCRQPR